MAIAAVLKTAEGNLFWVRVPGSPFVLAGSGSDARLVKLVDTLDLTSKDSGALKSSPGIQALG